MQRVNCATIIHTLQQKSRTCQEAETQKETHLQTKGVSGATLVLGMVCDGDNYLF